MKRFILLFSVLAISISSFSQLFENGYYRLENRYTGRYARLRDGFGRVDIASMSADMDALQTIRPYDSCLYDPASIITFIYVKDQDGYELRCQGASLFNMIGYYLKIKKNVDYYQAYAERSGVQIYLADDANGTNPEATVVKFLPTKMNAEQRDWIINPVNNEEGYFLGIKPRFECNGKYYTSYYTSFPYSLKSQGMNAYYVTVVDSQNGIVIYKEYTNPDVAESMPLFIECSSPDFTKNRLDVHSSYNVAPEDNLLTGVFFKRVMKGASNRHNFYVKNDTSTMRVLGIKADGKLGYIKSTEQYMPENSSYLPVPKNSPAEFALMTQEEYDLYMVEKNKARILTYYVDGEFYASDTLKWGDKVSPRPSPSKEGYFFTGWVGLPSIMPAEDVNVYGVFSPNYYTLCYYLDGEIYKSDTLVYGDTIAPEPNPAEREGYTFSGWSDVPATMPASNVTVYGIYSVNYYDVDYFVDGEPYSQYKVAYDDTIPLEPEPAKKGYTFSGWSEIPESMPAYNVTITGSFTVNYYYLTYLVDGELYKRYSVAFGDSIVPEPEPVKQGYAFSGWSEIPAVMPAQDVNVNGTFTVGLNRASAEVENVRYFSLIGQELAEPVEGVMIIETTYKDGRKVLRKQIVRH